MYTGTSFKKYIYIHVIPLKIPKIFYLKNKTDFLLIVSPLSLVVINSMTDF